MSEQEAGVRVAIVTGAGSGIGRATAAALGAWGWTVVLSGRRRAPLEETAELIEGETLVLPADVGVDEEARSIVRGTLEAFGRIDAIVNNAGMAPGKPTASFTWEETEALYRVNAIGPQVIIAEAWAAFEAQHQAAGSVARVVNVSSMATVDPFPGLTAYAASKAAVNLLTKGLANEGAAAGVRVFAVAPGAVETTMLRQLAGEDVVPRDQTLRPEDVAEVIVACVMGERDEENGGVILIPSGG